MTYQKIPWTEEPGVHGVAKSWTRLSDFTFLFFSTSAPSALGGAGQVFAGRAALSGTLLISSSPGLFPL